uniref:Nuclear nucleic acid-binding protein C1D n=1 Tax=Ornithodoros turicata TaxID=34597 RepID=A0A2R5LEL4_9ACAR
MAAITIEESSHSSDFPAELKERAQHFHNSLKKVRQILEPLLASSLEDATKELTPLDKARLDLSILYAMNSLFWTYLTTVGEDPKEHGIRKELDRIKEYMMRAKQIADKAKMPRLDQGAAGRFVRSSLWEPKDKGESGRENASSIQKTPQKRSIAADAPPRSTRRKR